MAFLETGDGNEKCLVADECFAKKRLKLLQIGTCPLSYGSSMVMTNINIPPLTNFILGSERWTDGVWRQVLIIFISF